MEILKSIILVELETVAYGTDPTPAVSGDEIIVHGQPSFDLVTRALARPVPLGYFGELSPVIIGEACKLSFKCEVTPSGTATTAPRVGKLLRAANCAETVGASSVTYAPHSTFEGESVTIYFWAGGTKHIMTGCVANIKNAWVAGELIMMDVDVTGLYGGTIADVTFPTAVYESTAPLKWTAANFKFNSVTTLVTSKLDFDFGNDIASCKDANNAYGISRYYVKDRKPKVSFDIEKVDLSTLNPWTLHTAQTLCDLESKPTGTAGNTIELVINDISIDAPKYGEKENVRTWEISGQPRVSLSAGNAEFSIVFK